MKHETLQRTKPFFTSPCRLAGPTHAEAMAVGTCSTGLCDEAKVKNFWIFGGKWLFVWYCYANSYALFYFAIVFWDYTFKDILWCSLLNILEFGIVWWWFLLGFLWFWDILGGWRSLVAKSHTSMIDISAFSLQLLYKKDWPFLRRMGQKSVGENVILVFCLCLKHFGFSLCH